MYMYRLFSLSCEMFSLRLHKEEGSSLGYMYIMTLANDIDMLEI